MTLRLALLLWLLPALAVAAPWRLDPDSRVAVDVGWRGATVEVRFTRLSGAIEFDETRPEAARARIVASTRDVETGIGVVDALVRSEGYLDTERWPDVVFELDRLERTSPQTARVHGRLTLRGVTRPLVLDATVFRYGPDPADQARFVAGFDIAGVIDRTDFGSTAGLPEVAAELGLRIRLVMRSA